MTWKKKNVKEAKNLCVAETYDLNLCKKVFTSQLENLPNLTKTLSRSVALLKNVKIVLTPLLVGLECSYVKYL